MEFKQYKITTQDYTKEHIPEAVLDDHDPINDIKRLAGLTELNVGKLQQYTGPGSVRTEGSNISYTSQEKIDYQNKNNIQPGTPEWFKLWFSLPYLTGEKPW